MKEIDTKDPPDVSGGFSPDDPCVPSYPVPFPYPDPDYPSSPVAPFPFPGPMPTPIDPVA